MDSLIARIRARVADPLRAVDSATWVVPRPIMSRRATVAEVDAAEAALGFAIPLLLRRLYTEIGNGGFGPSYGVVGVPTIPPIAGVPDIVVLYNFYSESDPDYPAHIWPTALVPVIACGCFYVECADFLRRPNDVVMYKGIDADWERPVAASLTPVADSLEERFESWLANAALE